MSLKSRYRTNVKHFLVSSYGWELEEAKIWTVEHPGYVNAMYEIRCPAEETAEFVNTIRENTNGA